jgi:hypothetical protein
MYYAARANESVKIAQNGERCCRIYPATFRIVNFVKDEQAALFEKSAQKLFLGRLACTVTRTRLRRA